ncbi:hypothetical protein GVN20_27840 [Runella sp. CRIBMP]|uniref:hypothetical protein n=1 Tax=Runella sp. CRIBMP TaxID=2683261 RepID=UPI0014121DFD|nr:hypothetical protein [Runella sp. CRIBMP]NBB23195.1 hypothetical protein [Runella sp. CRIBMP]
MKLIQLFKGYDNVLYIHAVSPSKFGLVESEPYYSINLDIEMEQNLILSYINNALIGSLNEKIFAEDVNPRELDKLQSPFDAVVGVITNNLNLSKTLRYQTLWHIYLKIYNFFDVRLLCKIAS